MRKPTIATKEKPYSCEIQQLSSMLASDAWSYFSTPQLKKILDSASLFHTWVLPPFGVISDEDLHHLSRLTIYSYMYIFILIFYLYTSSCIYFHENMLDLVAIWNNCSCKIYTKISNFLAKKKKMPIQFSVFSFYATLWTLIGSIFSLHGLNPKWMVSTRIAIAFSIHDASAACRPRPPTPAVPRCFAFCFSYRKNKTKKNKNKKKTATKNTYADWCDCTFLICNLTWVLSHFLS